MSSVSNTNHSFPETSLPSRVPPLQNGDRLTLDEFWRRYSAMPNVDHAELIEGVVYLMSSPVSAEGHGEPHAKLIGWLTMYEALIPGVCVGDNSTLRLDIDNAPQPDAYLRKVPGQCRLVDGYLEGAPEFIAEVAASSASYDLHDKLCVYRRHQVQEYLVVRTWDRVVDWFVLRDGDYHRQSPTADGIYRSEQFPGLWLNAAALLAGDAALLAGDAAALLRTLQAGTAARDAGV